MHFRMIRAILSIICERIVRLYVSGKELWNVLILNWVLSLDVYIEVIFGCLHWEVYWYAIHADHGPVT